MRISRRGALRALVAANALLALTTSSPAHATTSIGPIRFEHDLQFADAIVIATIGARSNFVPPPDTARPGRGWAYSDFSLDIEEVWKGPLAKGGKATLRLFGGELPDGDWVQGTAGWPVRSGDRRLLFMSRGTRGVWKDRWTVTEFGVYQLEHGKVFGGFALGMDVGQFKSLVRDASRPVEPDTGGRTGWLFLRLRNEEDRVVRSLVRMRGSRTAVFSMGGGREDTTALIPLPEGPVALEFYPVAGEPKQVAANVVAGRTDTLTVLLRDHSGRHRK